jgi:Flp pilus assembly protein TadD
MGVSVQALARTLLKKGDLEAASEVLQHYLEGNPGDFTAREILARVNIASNRPAAARSQLLRVWEQSANDQASVGFRASLANNIGASFDSEGNKEEAGRWFARSLELSTDFSPIPHHNLARLFAQQRQFGKALELLNRCKEQFPDDAETSALVGTMLYAQDRYSEAVAEFERLMPTRKAGPQAYSYLGGILCDDFRDLEGALRVLREGKELFPSDRVIDNNLAYVLLMRGDPDAARQALQSMSKGGPHPDPVNEVALTATWGLLHLLEGKLTEGERLYQEAEKLAAQLGIKEILEKVRQKKDLELGRAFARTGDSPRALRLTEQGLLIEGGSKSYRRHLQDLERSLRHRMKEPNA